MLEDVVDILQLSLFSFCIPLFLNNYISQATGHLCGIINNNTTTNNDKNPVNDVSKSVT